MAEASAPGVSEPRIPFALPDIGDGEIAAVVEALRSGWITTGPRVHQFEEQFAEAVGAPHALAVNSATSGLHLALEASGVVTDDAVIVPTVTFAASAETVRYLGAHPVLADVDPATGLMSPEHCREAIGRAEAAGWRVAAVMPVHLAGQACDMDGLVEVAGAIGARVVEDAAHAFPATHHSRPIGSIGDFTVFSFYATKALTTGEGGMITTADAGAAARMKVMRLHGIDRDAWDRYNRDDPGWYYEVIAPGFKYNMTDIAAAMGIEQLRRSEDLWARRAAIAGRYREGLAGTGIEPLRVDRPGDRHAWHLFVVRLPEGLARDDLVAALAAAGIGTSVHFIPLHRMPYYRDTYRLSGDRFPGAEAYYASCLSLPIYTRMSDADVDRVLAACRTAARAAS
ncbi:MAG: DegT/DnrJ/EryC1/StrS aminotransferase family protein [Actinobacteria bacterium]|nr:DegT/DnrJ/EryC1/StrS aminotransferase family protein [Actinomycetota bacterium]